MPSNRCTARPARPITSAAIRPAGPPPITATSTCSNSKISPFVSGGGHRIGEFDQAPLCIDEGQPHGVAGLGSGDGHLVAAHLLEVRGIVFGVHRAFVV